MGRLMCEKHGRQSLNFTCPHISAAVNDGVAIGPVTLRTYAAADLPWLELDSWYCNSCISTYGLPESGTLVSGKMEGTLDDLRSGSCPVCFQEWRECVNLGE